MSSVHLDGPTIHKKVQKIANAWKQVSDKNSYKNKNGDTSPSFSMIILSFITFFLLLLDGRFGARCSSCCDGEGQRRTPKN